MTGGTATRKKREEEDSQATQLVKLAEELFRFVQGTDGRAYGVDKRGPSIALPLRGRDGLRQRLARAFYERSGSVAGGSALTDALQVIEGKAADCEAEQIWLRVARSGEAIVLDLGDPSGRAVVIEPGSWQVVESAPVLFRRTTLTSAMPTPIPGNGSLTQWRNLLNADDENFALIVGWQVTALVPDIPHPILALSGEQGSAKTTAAKNAVMMIDPSPAPVRTAPRDLKEWAVTAAAGWTLVLDNVSTIPQWLSDALCRGVTGDGIVGRALFTDDDVSVLSFRRVIGMTSIDTGSLAGDLAERLLSAELHTIEETNRREDAAVAQAFEDAWPITLAALLDILAQALKALPSIHLDRLPRMADFARMLAAIDQVSGHKSLPVYLRRLEENQQAVLEGDPYATAILEFLAGAPQGFYGPPGDLLAAVKLPNPVPKGWPTTAARVGGKVRRIAPALRACGIEVNGGKSNGQRWILLKKESGAHPTLNMSTTEHE